MEITKEQYQRIEPYLPVQRGNVEIDNITFVNAILYVVENGCKWRGLPKQFGKWNSVYQRCRRWARSGVLQKLFITLQKERIIAINIEIIAVDSTSLIVRPDAHGAIKKQESSLSEKARADGTPNFMWCPLMIKP
jgi:transposase